MDRVCLADELTRRGFLQTGSTIAVAALSVAGCDLLSTSPSNDDSEDTSRGKGRESPELTKQVQAGTLPPVEDRLPNAPLVVTPVDQLGTYGGDWNTALLGPADVSWAYRTSAYEHLMNWDPTWTKPIPNIAESVEVDDQAQEFTIHLRSGMKWSDGEPFTADDIVFAYNDYYLNEILTSPPTWLAPDGVPGKLNKIDDMTLTFAFSIPNGLFLANIAQPEGEGLTNKPRHYLEAFHADYRSDIDRVAEDHGSDDWSQLFLAMANPWEQPELPRITPWIVTTPLGEGNRLVVKRNPYYWKVDTDGSQLPYIDRIIFDILEEEEAMLLKATNGEMDMHGRHITEFQNKPVLAQGRQQESYHFVDVDGASMNAMMISLNLTHKNPVKREIFQNKKFRIGLSHAIDREEIIDTAFQGQGEPWQGAPRREFEELFDQELAKQYTNFDPDLANQYLDEAGFTERGNDGIRLGPDGKQISFNIDAVAEQASRVEALELVRQYWREVGVDMRVRSMDSSLMYQRKAANEHDANIGGGEGGLLWDTLLDPRWYFPSHSTESNYAIPWANWFNNAGEPMEKPPESTLLQMELYNQAASTRNEEERIKLLQQLLQITKTEFYAMGLVLPAPGYAIVKDNMYNVPEQMVDSWMYVWPGPTVPSQYFLK